jgi:hypothetical protein
MGKKTIKIEDAKTIIEPTLKAVKQHLTKVTKTKEPKPSKVIKSKKDKPLCKPVKPLKSK